MFQSGVRNQKKRQSVADESLGSLFVSITQTWASVFFHSITETLPRDEVHRAGIIDHSWPMYSKVSWECSWVYRCIVIGISNRCSFHIYARSWLVLLSLRKYESDANVPGAIRMRGRWRRWKDARRKQLRQTRDQGGLSGPDKVIQHHHLKNMSKPKSCYIPFAHIIQWWKAGINVSPTWTSDARCQPLHWS